jgi:hypothetical protein
MDQTAADLPRSDSIVRRLQTPSVAERGRGLGFGSTPARSGIGSFLTVYSEQSTRKYHHPASAIVIQHFAYSLTFAYRPYNR